MKLAEQVNILLLGSGGREHAIATAIAKSPHLGHLYIAPGNAGTAAVGTNVDLAPTNFGAIKQLVMANNINLVVVGPEEPLVKGIWDFFQEDPQITHIPVVGPSQQGAQLEGSKQFAKAFMNRHGVPTAAHRTFTLETLPDGEAFLEQLDAPYVLKADGLAAGKGVVILDDLGEAKAELKAMLEGKFGVASEKVVIEECLTGVECSIFVATDGTNYCVLPAAKDYKRIGEGDTGLNTGGMGAISPVPFVDAKLLERITREVIEPTIRGLQKDKIPYKGFIFIGLMISPEGEPKVIEYNVRMGDPESEVVFPRIASDVIDLLGGIAYGTLNDYRLEVTPQAAATVIAASAGYPGDYPKGLEISGLNDVTESTVFHAGTLAKGGKTLTNGGRVLAVTSLGQTLDAALETSYESLRKISFEGIYYRKDIGR